jgi:putative lipoprotein
MRGLLVLSLAFQPQPGDGWIGRDKVKHFLLSAFVQSVAYSSLQAAGVERGPALAGASAMTLSVGVAKEVVDRRRGGAFSGRDLAWDAAGAGAATLLLVRTAR